MGALGRRAAAPAPHGGPASMTWKTAACCARQSGRGARMWRPCCSGCCGTWLERCCARTISDSDGAGCVGRVISSCASACFSAPGVWCVPLTCAVVFWGSTYGVLPGGGSLQHKTRLAGFVPPLFWAGLLLVDLSSEHPVHPYVDSCGISIGTGGKPPYLCNKQNPRAVATRQAARLVRTLTFGGDYELSQSGHLRPASPLINAACRTRIRTCTCSPC